MPEPSPRLQTALRLLEDARRYTLNLLDQTPDELWFRMPQPAVTHIAWQVGHLVMGDYRLGIERLRGVRPEDKEWISLEFLEPFRQGTTPDPDPSRYPAPAEIRATLDRVRGRMLEELADFPDAELDQPPCRPHPLFDDKLGSLLWCARHEMLHTGQIALLRRLHGAASLW